MSTIELTNVSKTFKSSTDFGLLKSLMPSWVRQNRPDFVGSEGVGGFGREVFSISNLNLIIPDGKTMVILGPSGCGKTTLLRLIAGLIHADRGTIRFDGKDMSGIPPGERKIGMVFQNYALYPMYTARQNILSYFLFRKSTPELDSMAREKFERTSDLLGVELTYLLDRRPTNLSAGEKQRVALGRCITRDPQVILLDEPFSNLDQKLREKYRANLKELLHRYGVTAVYVTHDQQEALILADILAIMNIGTIEQVGNYERIYRQPKSIFVAEFLNLEVDTPAINLIDGEVLSPRFEGNIVGFRPEQVGLAAANEKFLLEGVITHLTYIPIKGIQIFTLQAGRHEVYGRLPVGENLSMGATSRFVLKEFHLFDRSTGRRISSFSED